jgi:hypothetical protein
MLLKGVSENCITVRFGGFMGRKVIKIEKRKYIASPQIYRLWFEFYKIALKSKDKEVISALKKSKNFYASWGIDTEIHFDDWWKENQHLFYETKKIKLIEGNEPITDDSHLVISFPKDIPLEVLMKEFLERVAPELEKRKNRTKITEHRYAPTEVQGVKQDSLRLYFELYEKVFSNEKLKGKDQFEAVKSYFLDRFKKKPNEIPEYFSDYDDNEERIESSMRNVRRYKKKCLQLILNVANGEFPGRY